MRVLLIEDDADTASSLCKELGNSGYAVVHVADGITGLQAAKMEQWDLLIVDRMLGKGFDGLSLVVSLRQNGLKTPVLILSALASMDERVRGLRQGGDDYLTKPFAFPELLARVEALLRRSSQSEDAAELCFADLRLDLRARRAERSGQFILLQPREFSLLEYLVRHHDQVVTRAMLLRDVWGFHFDPQTNVIDVQISRLRHKIDKDFSPHLLHTVRGVGYRLSVARG
jgi:two-component system OmpR family response regulator